MGLAEFREALRSLNHVALDTPIFVYHFGRHARYGSLTRLVMDSLDAGHLEASASWLVASEVMAGPYSHGRRDLAGEYLSALKDIPNLLLHEVTEQTAVRAARIRGESRLKLPDAIIAATALEVGADALITNDGDFRRQSELPVILLEEYA